MSLALLGSGDIVINIRVLEELINNILFFLSPSNCELDIEI